MVTLIKDKIYPRQKNVEIKPYETEEDALKRRFVRESVLGYKAPPTAYNATYVDSKCPFTGNITVRGKIFKGVIIKLKSLKTAVVRINRLFYDSKYKRYARRNTKIITHLSPCFDGMVHVGDTVVCGETRPLSKTKHSVIIGIVSSKNNDIKVLEKK